MPSTKDKSSNESAARSMANKSRVSAAKSTTTKIRRMKNGDKIPKDLEYSLTNYLTQSQKLLVLDLCSEELGQAHLFDGWLQAEKVSPSVLRQMGRELEALNASIPGGLRKYVLNAKNLLKDSREGKNPLDGWTPSVPAGQAYTLGSKEFIKTEKEGIKELGNVGFVLVAGGLGERLGYGGIKVALPTESSTGTSYMQYYCEYIKAIESKCSGKKRLPLCIMVSADNKAKTIKYLQENKCFGLKSRQITIVQQGEGVPALGDNDARIIIDENDPFKIVTKPHGHGDIHSLLHSKGITKEWEEKLGIKWIVMFQDTNGLAFHSLPLMLGTSVKKDFLMNSLAIPRKAKQAIGGIATLTHSEGQTRTINVEYNMLDPLLRTTTEYSKGDENDSDTGFSPFPGNINQLVFRLKEYNQILDRTKGIMPEFVNPKYTDATKSVFKSPTRLECMMQDFPTVLEGEETSKVGFTQLDASLCFSPVKNSVEDGKALQEKGLHAGVLVTGEADMYAAVRHMMRSRGCDVQDAEPQMFNGITVIPGPAIVLKPDVVCCPGEYTIKFPTPDKVKISARSTLIVRGPGVIIESLELDGALIIDVDRGEEAVVRDLVVKNDGWVKIIDKDSDNEVTQMRGYYLDRKDVKTIEVDRNSTAINDEDTEPGVDWVVEERNGCSILLSSSSGEVDEGCSIL